MSWFLILPFCFLEPSDPIVIAHRGASGYAVEHTEAAKTLAHAQDADFIEIVSTGLVELAKQSGLLVHPYTVRKYQQPKWSSSIEETHRVLVDQLHVDGFTDYPDLGRAVVRK